MNNEFFEWLEKQGIKISDNFSLFTDHKDTKILLKLIEQLWIEIEALKEKKLQ